MRIHPDGSSVTVLFIKEFKVFYTVAEPVNPEPVNAESAEPSNEETKEQREERVFKEYLRENPKAKEIYDYTSMFWQYAPDSTQTANLEFQKVDCMSPYLIEGLKSRSNMTFVITMPHKDGIRYRFTIPAGTDLEALLAPQNGFAGVLWLVQHFNGVQVQ